MVAVAKQDRAVERTGSPFAANLWAGALKKAVSGKPVVVKLEDLSRLAAEFSAEEIDRLVIPKRTLARRKARGEMLSADEADRALRLARIGAEANRVFGNPEKARRWLRKPAAAFHGRTPLDLLENEAGARAVDELLVQIDHGMFA